MERSTSWVSPSLGDLLINAALLLIITWYALLLFRRYGVARYLRRVPGSTGQLLVASVACLSFFGGLLMLLVARLQNSFVKPALARA